MEGVLLVLRAVVGRGWTMVLSRESQAEVKGPGDGVGGFQVRALRMVSLRGVSDTCSRQERLCVSFSRF